ncbi:MULTISPECIES: DUF3080 family protein [unclassified Halomonas]|uniref:DUF3080 family protein n=1 Tax=unclassified Halomonas TaxID=2609666 RepID=UPI003F92B8D8
MVRWAHACVTLALSALLAGCGDSPAEKQWRAYHQQLATDLARADIDKTDIDRAAPANIGAFPDRKDRLIDIPETRDSILNVYALRECQITSLIAARNNQLGRVAPPSQQWLYERTLWQRLSVCSHSDVADQLNPEDQERLQQLTATKTAQLSAVSWNAIFDSSEWIKSFSRSSQPLANVDKAVIAGHLEAIDYLQEMTEHQFDLDWQQDSSALENHLKTLQERPLTAEILRALLLATQRLAEENTLLTQQSDTPTRCLTPWNPQLLEDLANTAHEWLTAINRLIDAQQVDKPAAVQRYQVRWLSLQYPGAPWQKFQQVSTEHNALRARFSACTTN